MRKILASVAFLAILARSALGDSVVLKSGEQIEWRTLRDKGDQYEIETPDGQVRTVDKRDVVRVGTSYVKPLTGASFSFEGKTKTADLLGAIDPKRHVVTGVVKGGSGALAIRSEVDAPTILLVPWKAPEEYDLALTVERRSAIGNFTLGLVGAGDRQFAIDFDGERGTRTATIGVSAGSVNGALFEKGKPTAVLVQVRRERLVVTVGGKEVVNAAVSYAGASVPDNLKVPSGVSLFLSTQRIYGNAEHAHFNVTKVTATFK